MGWGEPSRPVTGILRKIPQGIPTRLPPTTERERDLEERMTKIALVASSAIKTGRTLPVNDATVLLGDALHVIEQIAKT